MFTNKPRHKKTWVSSQKSFFNNNPSPYLNGIGIFNLFVNSHLARNKTEPVLFLAKHNGLLSYINRTLLIGNKVNSIKHFSVFNKGGHPPPPIIIFWFGDYSSQYLKLSFVTIFQPWRGFGDLCSKAGHHACWQTDTAVQCCILFLH